MAIVSLNLFAKFIDQLPETSDRFFFSFGVTVDIPEPLITSFRNREHLVPEHFDHINSLILNFHWEK